MTAPALALYAHPFSSYSQKVLIALWEKRAAFDYRHLEEGDNAARLRMLWPLAKFPVLLADDRPIFETNAIVEYLDRALPNAPRLIPADDSIVAARMVESVIDSWVMRPMQSIVGVALRDENVADSAIAAEARTTIDSAYEWLDTTLAGREWAAGSAFTFADCAAAPALFYADWAHPIDARFAVLRAYLNQLRRRQTVARAVDEARLYRHYFPLDMPPPADPEGAAR